MKKICMTLIAALIGMTAAMAQNSFEVSYKELPKDVQKYIAKNYVGYAVDKAMQEQDQKGKVTYSDVYISKGTEKLKLVFDKKGDFVKKETVAATEPANKPAADTAHKGR